VAMLGGLMCVTAAGFQPEGLFSGGRDHAVIAYSSGTEPNAVAELNKRLRQGSAHLGSTVGRGICDRCWIRIATDMYA